MSAHDRNPAELPPVDMERRIAFMQWRPDDGAALAAIDPLFQQTAEAFVEQFYQHLFQFPETARFLQNPQRVARLRETQREHFGSLLHPRWDDPEYIERRRQVGLAHADIGLEPQWYLGSYYQYVQHCFHLLAEHRPPNAQAACQMAGSLMKAMLLDMDLALDAYFFQSTHKLQAALQMYLQSNIQLRRFAQLTSHDLKTPLATVANLCDELLDEFGDSMPPEACKLVQSARQGIFRMSTLINELLENTIAPESTEVNDLVSIREILVEALDRVRPVLTEKEIEVELPKLFPQVWGNKVRLREAFYNLLSNAAKFIDKRPGRIVIDVSEADTACTISVRDNGPGIPREELERVFIPFRRLPEHRDRPGSGLGLYFAKSIVEEQQGKIWAESEPGQGTTFQVQLPRKPLARPR